MAGVPFAVTVTMHFEFRDFGLFLLLLLLFRSRRHVLVAQVPSPSPQPPCVFRLAFLPRCDRKRVASLADTFERLAPLIAAFVALSC